MENKEILRLLKEYKEEEAKMTPEEKEMRNQKSLEEALKLGKPIKKISMGFDGEFETFQVTMIYPNQKEEPEN